MIIVVLGVENVWRGGVTLVDGKERVKREIEVSMNLGHEHAV